MSENSDYKKLLKKYLSSAYILIALIVLLVIGRTLDIIEDNTGTKLSIYGSWLPPIILILFLLFVYKAFSTRTKR